MIPDIGKDTAEIRRKAAVKPPRRRLQIHRLKSVVSTRKSKSKPPESTASAAGENLVHGHLSIMGRRRAMEDAVTAAPPGWLAGEYTFFGVYDGHGGDKAAEMCKERMHKCLEKCIEKARKLPINNDDEKSEIEWEKVMVVCFSSVDQMIMEAVAAEKTGSTAVVVVVDEDEIVVANCGDSRVVLCRGGAVVPLSRDHKPDRPDEKERIEAAGGTIVNSSKGSRVQGVLKTTRSLGDCYLKPFVTSEPEVTITTRTEGDAFIVIATDGLWGVVSNELACEVVQKCLSGELSTRVSDDSVATEAAAVLVQLAVAKGSGDNISAVVVVL